jgi:predicted TIM-barrel fold metal-dependent hydrolase
MTATATPGTDQKTDRYTIISSDCHAGGSHAQYRDFLEAKYLDEFDAWRGKYKNPYSDLGDQRRLRNWDDDLRNGQQLADGIVGEVVFPNTVPPFFPSFVLFARPPKPEEYELRLAGIRAHNRWLVDWCERFPDQRAGIGQIFLNDVDDAIEDVKWIKENGLRGGILLPTLAPDVDYVKPLYDPCYDRLWAVCQDLDVVINVHGGTGAPDYGKYMVHMLLYINEVSFYSQRPLVQFILAGIFERFPGLKFVMTENGCQWVPGVLKRLDAMMSQIRKTGETGEIKWEAGTVPPQNASDYFRQNVWMGVSQPGTDDAAARYEIGLDKWMWGSDYPHDEGTHPFTREGLRALFHDTDPAELRRLLAGNCAELYGFDLDKLDKLAAEYGPTIEEIATPLTQLPEKPNEALLRATGRGLR